MEEIKQRLDVEDVVGSYLQLKPSGANLKGVCPFHHEKTPSLMVSPEKGIWHCFGCGEGGDIFTFVMKMDGLDFKEALERLAQKAGVSLERSGQSQSDAKLKERLYEVMELATKYYQAVYKRSKTAQAYIKKRGFTAKTVEDFRLGYAPAKDSLATALAKRGVTNQELIKAGLARQGGNKLYDVFRNRLMVPFADTLGRPVGFTARVLDDSLPKYLNTPQTLLFDKSRYIFALNLARAAIREKDEAVVVEGNLDVLASHQAGVSQVVATSGTALTQPQLKMLSRLTRNVKLAFDHDAAGLKATERSIPLAQAAGISLYIVSLDAKDPDELIQKDPKLWSRAIGKGEYVMDWLLRSLQDQYDLDTVPGKKRFSDHVLEVLAKMPDPVEQDHYAKALAKLINADPDSVLRKLGSAGEPKQAVAATTAATKSAPKDENHSTEDALLTLAASFADTRVSLLDLAPEDFSGQDAAKLFEHLRNHPEVDLEKPLPKSLQSISNYVKILLLRGEEEYKDWATQDRRIEAFSLATRLQTLFIKRTQKDLSEQLQAAEASGDLQRKQALLREFRDLSRKLS